MTLPRQGSVEGLPTFAQHWSRERERAKRWHHDIDRYVVVGRRRDDLCCVWDVCKAHRVSRWMRRENAERACSDVNACWRTGRGLTGWIYKVGEAA